MRNFITFSSGSTAGWSRRFRHWLSAALVMVAVACSTSTAPDEDVASGASTGILVGSVTLLGNDGPTHPAGHISLYASQADLESWTARYNAGLYRRSGIERTYDYVFANIVPGDYFIRACWTIGCAEYREPQSGVLLKVRIRQGRITTLHFGL
jgi:hypothetical protein